MYPDWKDTNTAFSSSASGNRACRKTNCFKLGSRLKSVAEIWNQGRLIHGQIDYGSHQRKHRPSLHYPNYSEGLEIIFLSESCNCGRQPPGFGWITENDDIHHDVSAICAAQTLHKDVHWGLHLQDVGGRHHLPEEKYFQKWFYLLYQQ